MNKKEWQSLKVGDYIVDDGIYRIIERGNYYLDVVNIYTKEGFTTVSPHRWKFPGALDKIKIL